MLITAAIIYSLTGCVKESMENSNISSDIVYDSQDTTGFDIDTVRKSIIVKGVTLELPKKSETWKINGHTKNVKLIM